MNQRELLQAIFEWPENHWRLLLWVAIGLALLDVLLIFVPLVAAALLIGASLGIVGVVIVSLL